MVDDCGKAGLKSLLRFFTGLSTFPPLGLPESVTVMFTQSPFLEANACFTLIKGPVVYDDQAQFNDKMDYGILNSKIFFGIM